MSLPVLALSLAVTFGALAAEEEPPKAPLLPVADMSRPLPEELRRDAVEIVVRADGSYAVLDRATSEERRAADLETLEAAIRELAAPTSTPSERTFLIRADRRAPYAAVGHAYLACGVRGVTAWRVFLVVDDEEKREGVLATHLPRDVGVSAGRLVFPVDLTVRITARPDEDDAEPAPAPAAYEVVHGARELAAPSRLRLRIFADADQPFGAVVAVLNEARRFDLEAVLAGDWAGKTPKVATSTTRVTYSGPAGEASEPPPLRPGVPLRGDPLAPTQPTYPSPVERG